MKRIAKRCLIVLLSLVGAASVLALGTALLVRANNRGLTGIRTKTAKNGDVTAYVSCSGLSGYSVQAVGPETQAYNGERPLPVSVLGSNVVCVALYDTNAADGFLKDYRAGTRYELPGTDLSFLFVFSDDHGVWVYIGSDAPLPADSVVVKTGLFD